MKKILLISGDPNSINSELIYKSLKKLSKNKKKKIYLISNFKLLKSQFKKLNLKLNISIVKNIDQEVKNRNIKLIDIKLKFKDPFRVNQKEASKFVIKSLNLANDIALNNSDVGIINCPIDKKLLKKKTGVTEYLSIKSKVKTDEEAMLIRSEKLAVCPITTHLDIKNISKKINQQIIIKKINTINRWYKQNFKKKPKFAVLGLNPHNAELRTESEERKIIIPTINKLKKKGFLIKGPLVADTIFINEYKKYDVIIGMYHDQVLTPFKTIFKFDAINITLGLKYLRVSPDHGIAKNLINKKKGNPTSLKKCLDFVNKF
tara:strand:- start:545 stop:1498 length:954 start_codon:yes stop_codon:yes gene_type:complete